MKQGPARPRGEEFDPDEAEIWGPVRTPRASGEVEITDTLLFGGTRIKPPRGMYASERTDQAAPDARNTCVVEIWNYGPDDNPNLGATLTSDMWIIHIGIRYEIIGQVRKASSSWQSETTCYLVRMSNNASDSDV